MAETSKMNILTKGIVKENPVLRLVLGTCPTLAITTAAVNGIGMGVAATLVLVGSNVAISLLRKVIPDKVRIPAFITIIATFVTIIQMLVKAFAPAIDSALGIYLPLIVVNCIILARAEMFASKNSVLPSILDALGMGIGFTAALTLMGIIRELLGAGTLFGLPVTQGLIDPMIVFILPPGGFFVFGILVALSNKLAVRMGKKPVRSTGCSGCQGCELAGKCDETCDNAGEKASYENAVDSPNGAVRSRVAVVTNSDVAAEEGEKLPESEAVTGVAGDSKTDAYVRTETEKTEAAEQASEPQNKAETVPEPPEEQTANVGTAEINADNETVNITESEENKDE